MDMLRGGWGPGMLGNGTGTVGAGTSYDAATEAIAAAFTTPPTTARKDLIDAAVVALKAAGVWAKLDNLYVLAAADSQAAKINWMAPSTFACTEVNSPAFVADRGFTGNSTQYLGTTWNPATNGVSFQQDSASLHVWSNTDMRSDAAPVIGVGGGNAAIAPWNGSIDAMSHSLNSANANTFAPGSSIGFFSLSRTGSANYVVYKNAGSLGTQSTVSGARTSSNFTVISTAGSGTNRQIAAGAWGGGLNSTEITALYNALAAYMAGLATDRIAAAFTTPPSAARKTLIQNCVTSLMQGGVWAKLDALYAFAAADSQAAKINWIAPGTFNCTEVNAPAFTADQGFTGASTKYLDSGFNSTTAPSPKYVQDSATIFGWSLTATDLVGAIAGKLLDDAFIIPHRTAQSHFALNQSGGGLVTIASSTALGFFSGSRPNSSSMLYYKDGALQATTPSGSQASTAPVNAKIVFLTSQTVQWVGQIAAGGLGQSLNATEQTALYNALRTYMDGLYTATNAETNTIVAAFTNPATPARKALIDTCVGSLKAAGVWAKLDALYLFAAADNQAAKINWITPGTYNCTEVNAPTFTANTGFTGASTKYLDTGMNPTTAPSPKFVRNDASGFAWGNKTGSGAEVTLAQGPAGIDDTYIYPRFPGDVLKYALHSGGNNYDFATTDGSGLISIVRTNSTTTQGYRNGTFLGNTTTIASSTLANYPFSFMFRSSVYYSGTVHCGGFGSQLSAADNTALYNALRTYLTGVGVP